MNLLLSGFDPTSMSTNESVRIIIRITHWFHRAHFLIPRLKFVPGHSTSPPAISQSPHGLIRESHSFEETLQRYPLAESRSDMSRDWQRGSNSCTVFKAAWLAFSPSCSFFGAFTSKFGKSSAHISVERADRGAVWNRADGGMGVSGPARMAHKAGSVARRGFWETPHCGLLWIWTSS